MTAEPGWCPYPGDPEGTVRRWNGAEWIGYPSTPPPLVDNSPTLRDALASFVSTVGARLGPHVFVDRAEP